jgi:hypothetical protein
MKLLGTIFLLAFAGAAAAHAQAAEEPCANGNFSAERDISLAKVVGADHLVFLNDGDGCPSEAASCRQRAYVVAGDQVLTARKAGAYVCAFYPSRGGGSAGWVQSARLSPLPIEASPPLSAWTGHWANGDNTIALAAKNGALEVTGEAFWPSAHPSPAQFQGGPNVGDLSGTARPKGAEVIFADEVCTAALKLIGGLLVVADNGGCGGMNVSFSAVYKRR